MWILDSITIIWTTFLLFYGDLVVLLNFWIFVYVLLCEYLLSQVLDWIENHGEAFLSKHTGVGKSLHRARALQKRHEDFEEVAQVWRNGWKIIALAIVHLDIYCSPPVIKTRPSQKLVTYIFISACFSEHLHECRQTPGGGRAAGSDGRVRPWGDLPGRTPAGRSYSGLRKTGWTTQSPARHVCGISHSQQRGKLWESKNGCWWAWICLGLAVFTCVLLNMNVFLNMM